MHVADNKGRTTLMRACEKGYVEIVRLLLQAGADTDAADNEGDRALFWACEEGHVEIVRLLLEAGADTDVADRNGYTAFFWASGEGHDEIVRLLLIQGDSQGCKKIGIDLSACFSGMVQTRVTPAGSGVKGSIWVWFNMRHENPLHNVKVSNRNNNNNNSNNNKIVPFCRVISVVISIADCKK